jgi:uncharacterized protein (UPF0335 family)
MNDTSNSPLGGYVDKMARLLEEQAALAGDIKDLRTEIKDAGFNVKAFNQAVKEKRKGASFQCGQLELELEMQTYRRDVGLPTTLEDAQERLRKEAAAVPEDKTAKRKRKDLN